MYSLQICQRLNESIFMTGDKMIEWNLQKSDFFNFFNFTLAHTVALLLIFSSPCACISPLPHFHVGASSLVLISTHLYIACLSPHYTAVCATGKLRSGCCDFNTQLCLGREKERERKKAPLTDRQTPVRPCPLSLLCVRVRDVSKWQESEEGEEWEKIVGALFGPQGESARRGEWGVKHGGWRREPWTDLSAGSLHVILTCEQWSHTEQPHMVASPRHTPLPAPTH